MSGSPGGPQASVLLRIRGRVQGVGFRASMARQASDWPALQGWVRNREDGSVEARIQGPLQDVEALIAWARRGPALARVDSIEREDQAGDPSLMPFRQIRD